MKTIKVIDLLNMIANGEEVPRYIRFDTEMYSLNPNNYYVRECGDFIQRLDIEYNLVGCLNDEVEIIEEDKIKRIEERESGWWPNSADGNVSTLKQAVNELIDAVNELRKEK